MVSDRVVLVTGGARGIGAATGKAFANDGALVVLADVLETEGAATAAAIGPAAHHVHLDVTDAEQWGAVVEDVIDRYARIDVLVNNAAVWFGAGLIETSPEDFRRVVEVNQTGVFLGMRAVADHMVAAGRGAIVNVASTAGLRAGLPYWSPDHVAHAYTASKWAVRGMTKAAAFELAPTGVRVNCVHPGPVSTPMMTDGHEQIAAGVPAGRLASPEEIAEVILFAASEGARFMSGADIAVDGASTV